MKILKNGKQTHFKNKDKHVTSIITKPNEPVTDGLLVWLDGRDGSCSEKTTTWVDRSGNNYNATLTGFGDFTKNEWDGYGLAMQAANRTVLLNNTTIPLPNNQITLEVYGINYDSDLFSGLIANNKNSYYYWVNSNNAVLWKNNKEFSNNNFATISDDIITHLTFVYYEKYCEIYKNGKLVLTQKNQSPTIVTSFNNGRVFCPYCSKYTSRVFSTRLYDRALTAKEIQQNYEYEKTIYRGVCDKQLKMTSFSKISVENEWNTEDFIINYTIETNGLSQNTYDAYLLKDGKQIGHYKCSVGENKIVYTHGKALDEQCILELYVEGCGIKTDSIYWSINDETEVPYISLYKVGPTFQPDEDVKFEYFIADANYIEYREVELPEGYSYPTFTVKFYVDDILVKVYENMNSADHFANLGKFTGGDHTIRAVCYDNLGRQSIDIWYHFRVWTDEYEIKDNQIYTMTESDLTKYNLTNVDNGPYYQSNGGSYYNSITELYKNPEGNVTSTDGTTILTRKKVKDLYCRIKPYWDDVDFNDYVAFKEDADLAIKRVKIKLECTSFQDIGNNNRIGLQQLIDDTAMAGYKKLVLLPGTYRIENIDGEACLKVPDRFTLDLNGAKIKLNGCTTSGCVMIEIRCRYDSHVINGTIEGDFFEHDYAGSPNNSEWVNI